MALLFNRAFFIGNMAKTLLNVRNDVRTYLDESTESDWLDSELNRAINKAYHRVFTAVVDVYEDYYITEATADTVGSQQEYSLPSDFYKIRRVEINYDIENSNTAFSRALPINLDSVRYRLANTNSGATTITNPSYYIQGDILGFLPIPSNNGDEAIKIWYVRILSDLVENSDNVDIPYADRYYGIISKAAAAEALRKGQQEPFEAKRLEDEAQADIDNMKRELEDRISEEGKKIIDTSGDHLDFGRTSSL